MKYTLTWTDANGKCWHLKKAHSTRLIFRNLRCIMPAVARKSGNHATIITLTLSAGK